MEEGKAGCKSRLLCQFLCFAVDVCAPGGIELVGVWLDGRGILPNIHILFLYSSSDKLTQCCEDHKVACNELKHRHIDTWSKYNQNLFSIDKHLKKMKISKFAF